jgi:glycosyltransferase involved in cell wall biosynthesis
MTRCLLDVSSLLRWSGQPNGMMRVEYELGAAAREQPTVVPVFRDPRTGTFRTLTRRWGEQLLGWNAAIDGWGTDYVVTRAGWRAVVPSRYPILRALERRRLTTGSRLAARVYDLMQRAVLAIKPHSVTIDAPDGQRLSIVPRELALGSPIVPQPDDVILVPSSDWTYRDTDRIAEEKARIGFKYAVVCYDIIPLLFPQFFQDDVVDVFRAYWHRMFKLADLLIVNASAIREDVERYCVQSNIAPPRIVVVPLAAKEFVRRADARLPAGLERDRYVLFVSTIEPRKNHRLLLKVWSELLAREIPQRHSFKLVFVGRAGWMVEDVLREIRDTRRWRGTLLHFESADDTTLDNLYRNAAFCVYPSHYEGFGLPIIEAYAHGKAVIVSNGGALREFAHLGPNLSPHDEAVWRDTIESWICQPELRRLPSGAAEQFAQRTWHDVASEMITAARSCQP